MHVIRAEKKDAEEGKEQGTKKEQRFSVYVLERLEEIVCDQERLRLCPGPTAHRPKRQRRNLTEAEKIVYYLF